MDVRGLEQYIADLEKEVLDQADMIGRDIDRSDKLAMEKRGLECRLEKAEAKLARVEAWAADPTWESYEIDLEPLVDILAGKKEAE